MRALSFLIAATASCASATALLGSTAPLTESGVCQTYRCTLQGRATLPGGVTFTSYALDKRGDTFETLPQTLFSFDVEGRHRLIGFASFVSGDDPPLPGKSLTARLVQDAVGRALPATKNTFIEQGYGGLAFRQDRDASLPLGLRAVLSNITARPLRGPMTYEPFYVTYVADTRHAASLRTWINRSQPAETIAAADAFLKFHGLRVSKSFACGPNASAIFPNRHTAPSDVWRQSFVVRGFTPRGCCGGPSRFHLPGLALSSITVDDREFSDMPKEVCLS